MDEQIPVPQKSIFPKLEDFFDLYLVKKAPFQLPPNVKEFVVKYGPYITLILMLLLLPTILVVLGLSAVFLPVGLSTFAATGIASYLSLFIAIFALVLEALALPGLFKRSKVGWNFVFYGVLISALSYLIRFDILSLILGSLIGSYILFQIRPYYK